MTDDFHDLYDAFLATELSFLCNLIICLFLGVTPVLCLYLTIDLPLSCCLGKYHSFPHHT